MRLRTVKITAVSFLIAAGINTQAAESVPEKQQSVHPLPQQFVFPAQPEESAEIKDIDALLQSFIDEERASSLAAFVAIDGKVRYSNAYGWQTAAPRGSRWDSMARNPTSSPPGSTPVAATTRRDSWKKK